LPDQDGYGMLSLAANRFGDVRLECIFEPEYFTPPPPVDSALVSFKRKPFNPEVDEKMLWRITRALYNQRRKNLLNGLKSAGQPFSDREVNWAQVLEEAGINYQRRPESLSLDEIISIVQTAAMQ